MRARNEIKIHTLYPLAYHVRRYTYLTLAYPHVSADSCNIQYPETVRSPGNTAGHAVSPASIPFEPSSLGAVMAAWMLIFFSSRDILDPRLRFNLQRLFQ